MVLPSDVFGLPTPYQFVLVVLTVLDRDNNIRKIDSVCNQDERLQPGRQGIPHERTSTPLAENLPT